MRYKVENGTIDQCNLWLIMPGRFTELHATVANALLPVATVVCSAIVIVLANADHSTPSKVSKKKLVRVYSAIKQN